MQQRSPLSDPVSEALLQLRLAHSDVEATHVALAKLPAGPGALIDVLARGELQLEDRGRSAMSSRLTSHERSLLQAALGRQHWDEVLLSLEQRKTPTVAVETRLVALDVLSVFGRSIDLATLLAWAEVEGTETRVHTDVRHALAGRLDHFLEREPAALGPLAQRLGEHNPSILQPIVAAVVAGGTTERHECLAQMLGVVPRFDGYILAELGHMVKALRKPVTEEVNARVRALVSHDDRNIAIEAIQCIGRTRDAGSIAALVDSLSHPDKVIRERALHALVQISGEQLPADQDIWRDWHERTTSWWFAMGQGKLRVATTGAPGAASLAIQELSKLRCYREEIVPSLLEALRRSEAEIVLLTEAALGNLGSVRAVPGLLEVLQSSDSGIARGAYLALRRISDEDHGSDAAAWRAAGW